MTARRVLALVAAVGFALGVASWQAALHWSGRNPQPAAVVHVGETAQVGGTTFRLEEFVVADRLPSNDPELDEVVAPVNTVLVHVTVVTRIVEADVDAENHYCYPLAVDDAGRQWTQDTTVGFAVQTTATSSCHVPPDGPFDRDDEIPVSYVFVVPAVVADEIVVDLELGIYDDALVRLAR